MEARIRDFLGLPVFASAVILCGESGLERIAGRISVFDCPLEDESVSLVARGDVFLSGLRQLRDGTDDGLDFIRFLDKVDSGGLVITDEHPDRLSPAAREYADSHQFPVVMVSAATPYADLITAINDRILKAKLSTIDELKIDKLLNTRLSPSEQIELLGSINPHLQPSLRILLLSWNGDLQLDSNLHSRYLRKQDSCIRYRGQDILLLSDSSHRLLKAQTDVLCSQLLPQLEGAAAGISDIASHADFTHAFGQARVAQQAAKVTGKPFLLSSSTGFLGVLVAVKDNEALTGYYRSRMDLLVAQDQEDKLELKRTMREFVLHQGSYKVVAQTLNQHENTIRYRVNKIKSLLDLEDDPIRFYETISLLTKLDMIYESPTL